MPDQETINGQLTLLDTFRKRLRIQIDQQKKMGTFAPAYIQLEIDDAQAQIKKIKEYLRKNGRQVEDVPEDGDTQESDAAVRVQKKATHDQPSGAIQYLQSRSDISVQQTADPSFKYDVFISYHPADKEWARKQLLPLLEQQHGLRAIIDYRDFEIGVPKLVNIESAVADSRYTLIVITPDWVADEWNNFQGLLASSDDPSGLQAKLKPVILKPAALPSRIKFLEPTDLTDPDEREIQLDRLIRSLKRSRS